MRKAEPRDPGRRPRRRGLAPCRRRAAAGGDAARDDPPVHRRRHDRAERLHRQRWSSTSRSTRSCSGSCATIPSLIPAAVEEYLRLLTPYRGFARTPTRDVEIGGRLIRKDEPVAVVFASANRDEDVFPEPDRFVLDRPNIGRHVAFGMGPHRCAGAPLATLMLRLTLEELLARTSAIEVVGEPTMTRLAGVGDAVRPGAACRDA